ncbi:hypothetical protein GT347_09555 [Xylophilus rhododendri]|uniref:Uncharacterized protein n=1 Tax=Xylophilus rhododendri TaxID=2697032 RepID=A0A857J5U9_9BURK|nr:hypothetical protein [Xylophilus rhododendri]QHI98215.1 hypothetical protein GT347_09555 [Xylophilus rhododendri]
MFAQLTRSICCWQRQVPAAPAAVPVTLADLPHDVLRTIADRLESPRDRLNTALACRGTFAALPAEVAAHTLHRRARKADSLKTIQSCLSRIELRVATPGPTGRLLLSQCIPAFEALAICANTPYKPGANEAILDSLDRLIEKRIDPDAYALWVAVLTCLAHLRGEGAYTVFERLLAQVRSRDMPRRWLTGPAMAALAQLIRSDTFLPQGSLSPLQIARRHHAVHRLLCERGTPERDEAAWVILARHSVHVALFQTRRALLAPAALAALFGAMLGVARQLADRQKGAMLAVVAELVRLFDASQMAGLFATLREAGQRLEMEDRLILAASNCDTAFTHLLFAYPGSDAVRSACAGLIDSFRDDLDLASRRALAACLIGWMADRLRGVRAIGASHQACLELLLAMLEALPRPWLPGRELRLLAGHRLLSEGLRNRFILLELRCTDALLETARPFSRQAPAPRASRSQRLSARLAAAGRRAR